MIFETLTLGQLETNCYIVGDEETGEVLVLDPAEDGEAIGAHIKEQGWNVKAIVLTHGHFDHMGGMAALKECTGADVYLHSADAPSFHNPDANLSFLVGKSLTFPDGDGYLQEGDTISAGSLSFAILHTPGHSPGGISLYGEGMLFSGDTLFRRSIGRYDFGDYQTLLRSVKRLLEFPPETKVYPGHGESTTIGYEREHNPWA